MASTDDCRCPGDGDRFFCDDANLGVMILLGGCGAAVGDLIDDDRQGSAADSSCGWKSAGR